MSKYAGGLQAEFLLRKKGLAEWRKVKRTLWRQLIESTDEPDF